MLEILQQLKIYSIFLVAGDITATKNIEYIGGYKEYIDGTLFTFTFENDYTTIMTSKIEGVEGSRVPFLIAYQNLLP